MPFDATLLQRLRGAVSQVQGIAEQPMFGGICFMTRGNMLCGVHRERLMFRVGKDQDEEALRRPGARPMELTGRRMAGFIFVDGDECDEAAIGQWVAMARRYVDTLPAKVKSAAAPAGKRPKKARTSA